jgi:hypothetical protein
LIRSGRLTIAALCIGSALTGCVAPRSVVALEKLKLEGEPYYVEDRRHECGCHEQGFSYPYDCRSFLWNVWRTSGSPQQKLETLDREMISVGFERIEEDYAKETEKDHWVLLYEHPQGVGAMVMAGHVSPDAMLSSGWPPRRDRTNLEGEYIYGVTASYQSSWDWLGERWRNGTWLFRGMCKESRIGSPRPS